MGGAGAGPVICTWVTGREKLAELRVYPDSPGPRPSRLAMLSSVSQAAAPESRLVPDGERMRQGLVRCACALVLVLLGGGATVAESAGAPTSATPTRVAVTLVDFRIRMSPATARPGRVVFDVVNRGAVAHDLVFAKGGRTRVLQPGQKQRITVSFSRSGAYRFFCSVPGHRALGMKGTLRIGTSKPSPSNPKPQSTGSGSEPPPPAAAGLRLAPVATGLGPLTDVVAPPDDPSRLLVVQQDGLVRLLRDGVLQERPFLDLRAVVHADGEKGLLSIAFAPDYTSSGLLYAYYNDLNGDVRVVEYHRSADDPDSADPDGRELLRIIKPTADHNGGMMQFGPDGYLYIAVGDGGADPPSIPVGASGQTLDDLLGGILRIDPRNGDPYAIPAGNPFAATPGARPEIVAYGLRNPWRFWIDPKTDTMLIGDVGEGAREEIDRLPLDSLGLDFGWPCREGTTTPPDVTIPRSCETATLTPPLYEYAHSSTRCSITGGVVVRDPRLPTLDGRYLWSDLCDGQLYTIDPSATTVAEQPLGLDAKLPTSFGTDAQNRVYVATAGGDVYRIDPAS
jgi:glucose/arabinose dehydrogenase